MQPILKNNPGSAVLLIQELRIFGRVFLHSFIISKCSRGYGTPTVLEDVEKGESSNYEAHGFDPTDQQLMAEVRLVDAGYGSPENLEKNLPQYRKYVMDSYWYKRLKERRQQYYKVALE